MTQETVALALTAFFTFGCISIYEARQHARAMTPALGIVAVCLGLFVALVAAAEKPGAIDHDTAVRVTQRQLR